MSSSLRLGLIGAGRWGRNYIRTLGSTPGARLAALASRNAASADLVPADCEIHADWRDLITRGRLDAVIVATPPALHAEMALAAIDAGLPVLIEKPLCLEVGQAAAIRERAAARGVLAMVGHTHLFHPAYRALKARLHQQGPIRTLHAEAGNFGPYRPDVPVLWDWGAHDVAMALDLVGLMPERVAAIQLEHRLVEGGLGETVTARLDFPGGAAAQLRWSNVAAKCRRLTVVCERGVLVYDDLAADKLAMDGEPVVIASDLPLAVTVAEFAAAVAAGSRDAASVALGVRVVEVLAACAASVAHGTSRAGSCG